MKRVEAPSYPVQLFIAGRNVPLAEEVCATYCDEVGLCVTVTLTEYIYTGGKDLGLVIGLINYPRFPADPETIWDHAEALGVRLREALKQESFTIQALDKTLWFSWRAEEPATGGEVTP